MNFTAAGVFGGIGGGLLGAQWAGFDTIWNYEPRKAFDKATFDYNFPTATYYKTDKKVYFPKVHLLLGSPDCKQFSNLGTKRKDRGKLHLEDLESFDYLRFLKFVLKVEPDVFVLENVPNILKTFWFEDNTLFFSGAVNNPILALPHYRVQVVILDSFDFGVAQHRRRLFVIGSNRFNPHFDFKVFKNNAQYDRLREQRQTPKTVEAAFDSMRSVYNHKMPRHTPERIAGFKKLDFGESYYGTQNNKRLDPDKPAGTVTSHCSRFVHPYQPRVLTVRENARLMGFPDYFKFLGTEAAQLDQVGKSIVPQVSMALACYIKIQLKNAKISIS